LSEANHKGADVKVVILTLAAAVFGLICCGQALASSKVKTTLDGKTVLPHRIRWAAQPGISRSRVAKVEFVIDGKLRWVERKGPYVRSGEDGVGGTSSGGNQPARTQRGAGPVSTR
jgi:hypothetical protein